MRYRDAGVDVERADRLKDVLGRAVRGTWGPAVRRLSRGFAGIMEWPGGSRDPDRLLLAASMDGVGTKLHVALAMGRVADACADLVYHGANDLLVHGARPLAFLDYIAQSRLDAAVVQAAVEGMSRACSEVGCALLGGETAEMPDTYLEGVVDVAGCMIGVVPASRLLDGSRVREGDVVLGLGADGLHTNGFSLARRVVASAGLGWEQSLPEGGGESVGAALLAPHRWYGRALEPDLASGGLHALAHVTGGGIGGNLVRVLPDGACAVFREGSWPVPPLMRWLMQAGSVPIADAREAFNLGVGMVAVVDRDHADDFARRWTAAGERVWTIGDVRAGERAVVWEGSPA